MKKLLGGVVAAAAAITMFAATAAAANPHFIRAHADIDHAGNLVVSWKEAGLGDNQIIDDAATADSSGFYACINGGGKRPQAANKEAFEGPVWGWGRSVPERTGRSPRV